MRCGSTHVLAAVLASACNASTPSAAPAERGAYGSGSRLRARVLVGWYDAQLDVECHFFLGDSSIRSAARASPPDFGVFAGDSVRYLDASCSGEALYVHACTPQSSKSFRIFHLGPPLDASALPAIVETTE